MKTPTSLKWAGAAVVALAVLFALAQNVRPERPSGSPDPSHAIESPLAPMLIRACGDCHSAVMQRAWYTELTPFSFVMARAASEGRRVVDFSEWTTYAPDRQRALLAASCDAARAGRMPVAAYLRFRPDARLTASDVAAICAASRVSLSSKEQRP